MNEERNYAEAAPRRPERIEETLQRLYNVPQDAEQVDKDLRHDLEGVQARLNELSNHQAEVRAFVEEAHNRINNAAPFPGRPEPAQSPRGR